MDQTVCRQGLRVAVTGDCEERCSGSRYLVLASTIFTDLVAFYTIHTIFPVSPGYSPNLVASAWVKLAGLPKLVRSQNSVCLGLEACHMFLQV